MDILTLNTNSLSSYAKAKISCTCGSKHSIKTEMILMDFCIDTDFDRLLSPLLPRCGVCTVISDNCVRQVTARRIEKSITKSGYRVASHIFESGVEPSVENASKVRLPEDTKLLIGVGGGTMADITKYVAHSKKLPCVFVNTSPDAIGVLTPSAMLYENGIEQTFITDPFRAVACDSSLLSSSPTNLIPASFGDIASKLVAVFDYKFAHVIAKEKFCTDIFEQGYGLVASTIDKLYNGSVSKKDIPQFLTEMSLRYSALSQLTDNSRLLSGAESSTAHILNILFAHETREIKYRGESEFLASRVIVPLYKNILTLNPEFFVPPPDNNLRVDIMQEFLGLGESVISGNMRQIMSPLMIRLTGYRFREYRAELLENLKEYNLLLDKAWRVFKRLYCDDGYSLIGYLDPSDLALSLALAPDLKNKYTMLSYLKDHGLTEEYITGLL